MNQRKADRLPHEAGLKLLSVPRAPKELPVSALIRNLGEIEDWKPFLKS
ncbi:HNH endonuclease (fragment) [Verrucomicrobia bacterium]